MKSNTTNRAQVMFRTLQEWIWGDNLKIFSLKFKQLKVCEITGPECKHMNILWKSQSYFFFSSCNSIKVHCIEVKKIYKQSIKLYQKVHSKMSTWLLKWKQHLGNFGQTAHLGLLTLFLRRVIEQMTAALILLAFLHLGI